MKNHRRKLFTHPHPYAIQETSGLFLEAITANVSHHMKHCPPYAQIVAHRNAQVLDIKTEDDLAKVLAIPTLYLKKHHLCSALKDQIKVVATSSGTSGRQSQIFLDQSSIYYGLRMMLRFFWYHKVISFLPTNYIVLGYKPSKTNQMGAVKTAHATTNFAFPLHREYALSEQNGSYQLNIEGIKKCLLSYAKQPFPVRFVGFPSYMYFLVKSLKEHNISLKLPKKSKILLGGGWKQFASEEIDQDSFYALIDETLGMKKEQCMEFFSVVEHPIPYCKCFCGFFHVPIYSRVIIRDVLTLEPVPYGEVGLLNMMTPLVTSTPLTSVVSDDLAILYHGPCGCGLNTSYFELQGRAGLADIKTCAATAAEELRGEDQ